MEAQYKALCAVNKELMGLYRDICSIIVIRRSEQGWGKSIVQKLSDDLKREFPGIKGFSVRNLLYIHQFYHENCDYEKLQPLVGEIGWIHNIIIMSRCKEPLQEGQERSGYSIQLPEELSENLNRRYGKGFSASNLKLFRKFYPAYPDRVPVTREREISVAAGFINDELGTQRVPNS